MMSDWLSRETQGDTSSCLLCFGIAVMQQHACPSYISLVSEPGPYSCMASTLWTELAPLPMSFYISTFTHWNASITLSMVHINKLPLNTWKTKEMCKLCQNNTLHPVNKSCVCCRGNEQDYCYHTDVLQDGHCFEHCCYVTKMSVLLMGYF